MAFVPPAAGRNATVTPSCCTAVDADQVGLIAPAVVCTQSAVKALLRFPVESVRLVKLVGSVRVPVPSTSLR